MVRLSTAESHRETGVPAFGSQSSARHSETLGSRFERSHLSFLPPSCCTRSETSVSDAPARKPRNSSGGGSSATAADCALRQGASARAVTNAARRRRPPRESLGSAAVRLTVTGRVRWGTTRSGFADVGRLQAFRAFDNVKFYLVTFGERAKSIHHDRRMMDEHILATLLGDEPEPLRIVEPLHSTLRHRCNLFEWELTGSGKHPSPSGREKNEPSDQRSERR